MVKLFAHCGVVFVFAFKTLPLACWEYISVNHFKLYLETLLFSGLYESLTVCYLWSALWSGAVLNFEIAGSGTAVIQTSLTHLG